MDGSATRPPSPRHGKRPARSSTPRSCSGSPPSVRTVEPNVSPLVAVWLDDALHFCTGSEEQKAVNLRGNQHVVLTTGCNTWEDGLDVTVEGVAVLQTDPDVLERLATAWGRQVGRPLAVHGPGRSVSPFRQRGRCARVHGPAHEGPRVWQRHVQPDPAHVRLTPAARRVALSCPRPTIGYDGRVHPVARISRTMELRELADRLAGDVVLPGDETWDAARQAWNLAVDQRPVAVVYPESADDVVATVRFAAEHGLRIAFNAGGHNAGPIDWSRDTLLLKTERMDGIEIDVGGAPRARRGGGAVAAARGRRRRPRSRLSRRHVTERRRARLRARGRPQLDDPHVRPRLQQHRLGRGGDGRRAARQGRPRDRARAVLGAPRRRRERRRRDRDRARAVPGRRDLRRGAVLADRAGRGDPHAPGATGSRPCPRPANRSAACSSCRTSRSCPKHVRGRSFVLVEAAFIGSASDGAALLQPLRDLGPEMDTIAMMPTSELSVVNMDPDDPLPYSGEGILLTDLPPAGHRAMVEAFVGSPLLHVEVRHLGGAAAIAIAGARRARCDRSAIRVLHLRARAGCRGARRRRSPRQARSSGRSGRGTAGGDT